MRNIVRNKKRFEKSYKWNLNKMRRKKLTSRRLYLITRRRS